MIILQARFCKKLLFTGSPGSVVGIATAYGLDGPGIESVCLESWYGAGVW